MAGAGPFYIDRLRTLLECSDPGVASPSLRARDVRAGATDTPGELPGPAAVQALALAQRPLAQAGAMSGDLFEQSASRSLSALAFEGRATGRVQQRGEQCQIVLLAEQFPESVRAAGELGDALARQALDIESFEGIAQVLNAFTPLVERLCAARAVIADPRSASTPVAATALPVDPAQVALHDGDRGSLGEAPEPDPLAQAGEFG